MPTPPLPCLCRGLERFQEDLGVVTAPIHALPPTVEEGVATLQPRPAAPGPEFAALPDVVASPATPDE